MLDLDAPIALEPSEPRKIDPKWSKYQGDIFEFVDIGEGSANIEAVAGSGKTTTILESMNFISRSGAVMFLAFNRSIADELKHRVPDGVEASTFHSLGNRALLSRRKMKLDKRRVQTYMDKAFDEKYKSVFYQARQLVDLARNIGLGLPGMPEADLPALATLADDFDIAPRDPKNLDLTLSVARSTMLSILKDNITTYDFTDMLYLPLLWDLPFPKAEMLYVDEAQDLNAIQHMIIQKSLVANGRVIAVGDTHQAIYGFRGADSSSMASLKDLFNSKSFPLSISYRCPKAVITLAQTIVPHITSAATAIDGSVSYTDEYPDLASLTVNDMVLCRNNAPLIAFALQMLAARLPMRVLGDFGDKLISFVRSFKTSDINIFERRLHEWFENESARLTAQEKWSKLGATEDKYNAILMVMKGCRTVEEILDVLARLFEQGHGPIIASIHKSKGLEADRVFLLYPELIPSKYAHSVAALQQERNLLYVAYTRAKRDLILISEPMEEAFNG